MTVDVVIPTRDRPDRLAATLGALARQEHRDFGVIIVDDGSRVPVAAAGPGVRVLRNESSMGPGPSRNRGVEHSRADFVVFLDDDCLPDPALIGRHLDALATSPDPVVSLGPILTLPGRRLSPWTHWDADRVEREYVRIERGERRVRATDFYTGNAAVRRADFLAIGGFDGRFARQEDVELGHRLERSGCRFAFDASAIVRHDSDRSLRSWCAIPAKSARFDVLMDRLDPDSGRLSSIHAALASRHWALRAARRAVRGPRVRRAAVAGAVATGRALHAVHADRAALAAFSLVWDLTYWAALQEASGE